MERRNWVGIKAAPSSFRPAVFPSTGRRATDWSSSANMMARQFLSGLPRLCPEAWVLRVLPLPRRPQIHRKGRTIERLLARCRGKTKVSAVVLRCRRASWIC